MDRILKSNLRLMQSTGRGGMTHLLNQASFGARGSFRGFGYFSTNFFYDGDGKIIEFTNKKLPESDVEIHRGGFRIIMDIKNQRQGIARVDVPKDSPRTATVKLVESAKELNQIWGWPECEVELGDFEKFLGQK